MQIAYVDETGTDGNSAALVMVGVLADVTRLARTNVEFATAFSGLSDVASSALTELKSSDLYRGRGSWKNVAGEERHSIISDLCRWVADRKHQLTLASIDLQLWADGPLPDVKDPWLSAALHTALQVQRANQGKPNNKGVTFLVFDEQKQKSDKLAELLFAPPAWTDEYYQRGKKQHVLDQVLDTAFYAKSHHVGLVQVADLYAFIFRRYAELLDYGAEQSYQGEGARITEWVELLAPRLLGRAHRWPAKPSCDAARWFVDLAPPSLRNLK